MSSSYIGKVLDNYRILERLGIGGMGVVFKAIHIKLDKVFALKIIAPGLAMNEHFIKRFETEAKSLAKFEDPNIVRIYDLRSHDDQWFIIMEYVEGQTLTDKILKDGAFRWLEALPIIKQVLSAIGHAHEAGIIHRDIKPNNIMLNEAGKVKITDFGLAKDQTSATNTISVTSGGTLYYMSPEHVKGFSFIDARSDLYSIGMTFYEMLTGIVPFQNINSDFEIRESIVRKEFDKPRSINPAIPADLEEIVMKSISKNPDDRYQTADAMIQALFEFETRNGIAGEIPVLETVPAPSPLIQQIPVNKPQDKPSEKISDPSIAKKKRHILPLAAAVIIIAIIAVVVLQGEYFTHSASPVAQIREEVPQATLAISSTPASAWIILNGDSVGLTPLKIHPLNAGRYALMISKKQYQVVDTTFSITGDSTLDMAFTLNKKEVRQEPVQSRRTIAGKKTKTVPVFASLMVESDPAFSEVWLNGRLSGKTPLRLTDIRPGTYKIEIRQKGFESYSRDMILVAGNHQNIGAKLNPLSGGLSVIKDPRSAKVLVDGKEYNSQDLAVLDINNLPVGKHQIEVIHAGYAPLKHEVKIEQNKIYTLDAKLVRLEGNLSIQVRPWGSIFVNGQMQESSADIKYSMRLPVKKHDIRVEHPTLGFWQKTVQIRDDMDTNVIVNFTRQLEILIEARDEQNNPLGAEIIIDGKNTGQITPGALKLRIGIHKVGVIKDGYASQSGEKEVLIDTGMDKPVTFVLKKIQ